MWCPITQSVCYPYDSCAFKDKEDVKEQKCLVAEALKVYIKNNQMLKMNFSDPLYNVEDVGMFI